MNEHYSDEYSQNADDIPYVDEIADVPALIDEAEGRVAPFISYADGEFPEPPSQVVWHEVMGGNVFRVPSPYRPTRLYMLFSSAISADGIPSEADQFGFECGVGEQDACLMPLATADGTSFTVPADLVAEHGPYVIVQAEWFGITRDEVPTIEAHFASYALDLSNG